MQSATGTTRLGVFGGTFDPVHLGHLILAEQCREQASLDRILFVPAALPPHKRAKPLTSFDHRAEMLELATSGNSTFTIDAIESERSGPSYMVDTLAELQNRRTGSDLFLLMGGDTIVDLPNWHQPQSICDLATLVIVQRPGWDLPPLSDLEQSFHLPVGKSIRLIRVESPLIDIASTEIRRRVSQGRSIRYLVPRAVEMYIKEKGLYVDNGWQAD